MSEKAPKYSQEQIAELEKSRTISDDINWTVISDSIEKRAKDSGEYKLNATRSEGNGLACDCPNCVGKYLLLNGSPDLAYRLKDVEGFESFDFALGK